MHFSSLLFPLALLASFVVASPLEQRGTRVTAVDTDAAPEFQVAEASVHPSSNVQFDDDATGVTGVSKRSDYNELTRRSTDYGTLIVCSGSGCSGSCTGYDLPPPSYGVCYRAVSFNSAYVEANDGLTYGVYVGPNCNGTFTCQVISGVLICDNTYLNYT